MLTENTQSVHGMVASRFTNDVDDICLEPTKLNSEFPLSHQESNLDTEVETECLAVHKSYDNSITLCSCVCDCSDSLTVIPYQFSADAFNGHVQKNIFGDTGYVKQKVMVTEPNDTVLQCRNIDSNMDRFASCLAGCVIEESLQCCATHSNGGKTFSCQGEINNQDGEMNWPGTDMPSLRYQHYTCNLKTVCHTPNKCVSSLSHRSLSSALVSSVSLSHNSLFYSPLHLDDSHLISTAVSSDALLYHSTWTEAPNRGGREFLSMRRSTNKHGKGKHTGNGNLDLDFAKELGNLNKLVKSDLKNVSKFKIRVERSLSVENSVCSAVSKRHSVPANFATPNLLEEKQRGKTFHPLHSSVTNAVTLSRSLECVTDDNHNQPKLCRILPFSIVRMNRKKETIDRKHKTLSSNIKNSFISFLSRIKTTSTAKSSVVRENSNLSKNEDSGISLSYSSSGSGFCSGRSSGLELGIQHRQLSSSGSGLLSCLRASRPCSPIGVFESDVSAVNPTVSRVVTDRALPPLPVNTEGEDNTSHICLPEEPCTNWDISSMIDKVKDCAWYWGPITGETAEKILATEQDGSFIVRDSSDDRYIFSLTFKLNGALRHVRIDHDQGNFSFGSFTKFKSQTIVEFIESAVEHSRSGRYLFFLHRRPVQDGPMRVQLLHPVSRFRHIQSLQHLCRYVIVGHVRRDLIVQLPLPQRLRDYLSSPHYYSERAEMCTATNEVVNGSNFVDTQ